MEYPRWWRWRVNWKPKMHLKRWPIQRNFLQRTDNRFIWNGHQLMFLMNNIRQGVQISKEFYLNKIKNC